MLRRGRGRGGGGTRESGEGEGRKYFALTSPRLIIRLAVCFIQGKAKYPTGLSKQASEISNVYRGRISFPREYYYHNLNETSENRARARAHEMISRAVFFSVRIQSRPKAFVMLWRGKSTPFRHLSGSRRFSREIDRERERERGTGRGYD